MNLFLKGFAALYTLQTFVCFSNSIYPFYKLTGEPLPDEANQKMKEIAKSRGITDSVTFYQQDGDSAAATGSNFSLSQPVVLINPKKNFTIHHELTHIKLNHCLKSSALAVLLYHDTLVSKSNLEVLGSLFLIEAIKVIMGRIFEKEADDHAAEVVEAKDIAVMIDEIIEKKEPGRLKYKAAKEKSVFHKIITYLQVNAAGDYRLVLRSPIEVNETNITINLNTLIEIPHIVDVHPCFTSRLLSLSEWYEKKRPRIPLKITLDSVDTLITFEQSEKIRDLIKNSSRKFHFISKEAISIQRESDESLKVAVYPSKYSFYYLGKESVADYDRLQTEGVERAFNSLMGIIQAVLKIPPSLILQCDRNDSLNKPLTEAELVMLKTNVIEGIEKEYPKIYDSATLRIIGNELDQVSFEIMEFPE